MKKPFFFFLLFLFFNSHLANAMHHQIKSIQDMSKLPHQLAANTKCRSDSTTSVYDPEELERENQELMEILREQNYCYRQKQNQTQEVKEELPTKESTLDQIFELIFSTPKKEFHSAMKMNEPIKPIEEDQAQDLLRENRILRILISYRSIILEKDRLYCYIKSPETNENTQRLMDGKNRLLQEKESEELKDILNNHYKILESIRERISYHEQIATLKRDIHYASSKQATVSTQQHIKRMQDQSLRGEIGTKGDSPFDNTKLSELHDQLAQELANQPQPNEKSNKNTHDWFQTQKEKVKQKLKEIFKEHWNDTLEEDVNGQLEGAAESGISITEVFINYAKTVLNH